MGRLLASGSSLGIGAPPDLSDQLTSSGLLAFSTAGDAADGLPFGWDIATLQNSVLIYLAISSLAFVLVWVIGYLRRR